MPFSIASLCSVPGMPLMMTHLLAVVQGVFFPLVLPVAPQSQEVPSSHPSCFGVGCDDRHIRSAMSVTSRNRAAAGLGMQAW